MDSAQKSSQRLLNNSCCCCPSYRSEPGRCEIELPHLRAGAVSADATALGLRIVTQGWRSRSLEDIV